MKNPRVLVITGASSGIGHALAVEYAAPGIVLALMGRDAARLAQTAQEVQAKGARTEIFAVDVLDRPAMIAALDGFHARHGVDLVIANAGVSSATLTGGAESAENTQAIFAINLEGTRNTLAAPLGWPNWHGQIAVMGSIAARLAFPSTPAYSAAKAAVETHGLALRGALAGRGIHVSVISPGYVTSPMSARVRGPRPFEIPASRAARIIRRGLAHNRARISFPWQIAFLATLAGWLPVALRILALRAFAVEFAD